MSDQILMVPLKEIFVDHEFNCRGRVAPMDVIDLARDIEDNRNHTPPLGVNGTGLMTPVQIIAYQDSSNPQFKYKLIAGHRRYTAFRVKEYTEIPALLSPPMSDSEAQALNLKENLKREDLDILQEAKALEHFKNSGWTEQMVMDKLGVSRGWTQVRYMLLAMPPEIQKEAKVGTLTTTHIRDLYSIKDDNRRFEEVRKIKEAKERKSAGLKVSTQHVSTKINKKKRRINSELVELMEHIQGTIGNNPMTRVLAWAIGNINDVEMHDTIKAYADAAGKEYTVPEFERK